MTEESCFTSAIHKEAVTIQRSFCVKKKYLTFFLGDLEGAKEMYLEGLQYSKLTAGRLIGVLISRFLDGMIGKCICLLSCHWSTKCMYSLADSV
jgi:hypothetical protein